MTKTVALDNAPHQPIAPSGEKRREAQDPHFYTASKDDSIVWALGHRVQTRGQVCFKSTPNTNKNTYDISTPCLKWPILLL